MNAVRTLSKRTGLSPLGGDLLRGSLLYRERWAEQEEILKHKWLESEKIGRDIGFEQAQIDWRLKHGSEWHRWRRQTRKRVISAN